MADEYLIPSFNFGVRIEGLELGSAAQEGYFQEISGLDVKSGAETAPGDGNRYTHKLPSRATNENLVLKRGVFTPGSSLEQWVEASIMGGLAQQIVPHTIVISLLDLGRTPVLVWNIFGAYPISLRVVKSNEKKEVFIENVEFAYKYFERMKPQ